ncbi:hypothetical protein ONA92_02140 [Mycobacteroides salmoniphilum]|uniref:NucA/NucB deoxyribonuclease domain-containing protein n=1 Tax=Mycobacteroides salmoniphilum TaxID=404941 RepID=UPI0035632923
MSFLWSRRRVLPSAVKAAVLLAVVLLPLSLLNSSQSAPVVSAVEQFGQAATAAFTESAAGLDTSLTSKERSAGLPVNPAAGLVSQSPAGAVDMVLPAGLGAGQVTAAGQMVYPDAGAGFDLLAENTRDGYRTVARINETSGARSVTTLVSTPADTVMLMHSSGHLTLNRATEQAETLGVMSPAEARDASGNIVYSAYVAKQVAPQLYQVSEVISPTESTTWPVYVDPPLAVGGDYSQFGWSDVDHTLDAIGNGFMKAGEAVGKAFEPLADGQQMQAQAMGDQVRQHPLESAMLVGSTALMATGVGSAAGAGVLARVSLTLNVASVGTEAVAATDPNNKGLQNFSAGMQIVAAITPQGLGKKAIENVAENALQQGVKKGGDELASEAATLTRVTPETATDATKLSQDVAAAGKIPQVPKAPNAPPGKYAPETHPACTHMDCGHVTENPTAVYNKTEMPGHYDHKVETAPDVMTKETVEQTNINRRGNLRGKPRAGDNMANDESPPASSAEARDGLASVRPLPKAESDKEGQLLRALYQRHDIQPGDNFQFAYRNEQGQLNCQRCVRNPPAPQAPSRPPERPSSPADLRQVQAARAEQATQAQRSKALTGARMVNSVAQQQAQHNNDPQTVHARPESEGQQRDNQAVRNTSTTNQTRDHAREGARPAQSTASTHNGNGSSHDSGSHSKNNGSKKNSGNGKGNRAKRSRTGRH